ncbi:MAG: hypothetical protein ABJN65_00995 [Parasphingorhabdus sp.]
MLSFIFLLALPTGPATAVYNANVSGKISDLITYTDGDYIYFRLDNQPATHPTCNPSFFVIDGATPAQRIDRLYSRAVAAKASGETVYIGYDSQGDCAHGYIRVHRVG